MAMPGSRRSFDRYPYRFVNLEGLFRHARFVFKIKL